MHTSARGTQTQVLPSGARSKRASQWELREWMWTEEAILGLYHLRAGGKTSEGEPEGEVRRTRPTRVLGRWGGRSPWQDVAWAKAASAG